jgi:hypothetical protein
MSVGNRLTHWYNEQALDCIEKVEDTKQSQLEISTYGRFQQYPDNSVEFFWKDKLMIHFEPPMENGLGMLDVEAHHLYEAGQEESYSEFNKE